MFGADEFSGAGSAAPRKYSASARANLASKPHSIPRRRYNTLHMSLQPEEFQYRIKAIVQEHYAKMRTPLLLSHLGSRIEKEQLWPSDRGQRSLKQLIEACIPDLEIVFDRRSPAFVAVVTPDVKDDVVEQIGARLGEKETTQVRLEDLARPILLAFCINVQNQSIYIRRVKPFRYDVGTMPPDRESEYVVVEPDYRRPGLRIDNLNQITLTDRKDLENRIQKWAAVHGLDIEQFSRLDQDDKELSDAGKTALDRLLAAQSTDIVQRMMIPADIAQILSRIR